MSIFDRSVLLIMLLLFQTKTHQGRGYMTWQIKWKFIVMISWEQWEFDLLEFHFNITLYEKTNLEPFFRQI